MSANPIKNTAQPGDDDESLTVKDVSRATKLCERQIRKLVAAKAIEHMRFGKSVRFTREAVRQFKESRTVKAVA